MAWTVEKKVEATVGNVRQQVWQLTADSATYELSTGLKNVLALSIGINTATAATIKCKPNILSAGTAALGNVAITGATSADIVYLTVYGS
jgi:hypothetical protein